MAGRAGFDSACGGAVNGRGDWAAAQLVADSTKVITVRERRTITRDTPPTAMPSVDRRFHWLFSRSQLCGRLIVSGDEDVCRLDGALGKRLKIGRFEVVSEDGVSGREQ